MFLVFLMFHRLAKNIQNINIKAAKFPDCLYGLAFSSPKFPISLSYTIAIYHGIALFIFTLIQFCVLYLCVFNAMETPLLKYVM